MWNLIAAYGVIAVILVAYVLRLRLRTRQVERALESEAMQEEWVAYEPR
jgi:hypothetical protein